MKESSLKMMSHLFLISVLMIFYLNKYVDRTLKFIKLIITEQLNQLHQEE